MILKMVGAAIRNRKITLFLMVLLMAFGLYSYVILPKQETPEVNPPVAVITTAFPGASPADVERLVTRRIEDIAVGIDGYDYVESRSRESLSIVVLWLENGADASEAWTDLRRKLSDLQRELPEGCEEIRVNTNVLETAGIIVALSADGLSEEDLVNRAEEIKDELSRVEGIERFEIVGGDTDPVAVEVDVSLLNLYGLSLTDLGGVLKAQGTDVPVGSIETGQGKIGVGINSSYSSLEELADTVVAISPDTGAAVRVRDLARVQVDRQHDEFYVTHEGKRAVLLAGYFKSGQNILSVGHRFEARLGEIRRSLPAGVTLDLVTYQPDYIRESINGFLANLVEGMGFVLLTVFVGMNLRNALVVSIVIPFSILMAFGAMAF